MWFFTAVAVNAEGWARDFLRELLGNPDRFSFQRGPLEGDIGPYKGCRFYLYGCFCKLCVL